MQVDPRMYKRQMTEEEERMMMSQTLRGNDNMMVADANMIGPGVMTDADAAMLNERSRGAELIPPGADMSQFNDVTGTGVIGSGVMTENEANMLRNNVSPMGTPMTPEQIDEEIMRLQMLKNQMMMGN